MWCLLVYFVLEQDNFSGVVSGRVELYTGRTWPVVVVVEAVAAQRHNF